MTVWFSDGIPFTGFALARQLDSDRRGRVSG